MTRKLTWGEDRVFYYDASGKLKSLLTNVTDVVSKDAFDRISAGRSAFRVDDLLELHRLFDRRKHRGKGEHRCVRVISPHMAEELCRTGHAADGILMYCR